MGDLSIARAAADERDTAASGEVLVTLVTGEMLRGVIIEFSPGEVVISHSILGRLVLPRSSIASIVPAVTPVPSEAGAESLPPADPSPKIAPSTDPLDEALDADEPSPSSAAAPAVSTKRAGDPPKPAWAAGKVDLLETDGSLPAPGSIEWLGNLQASLAGVDSDTNQFDLRTAGAVSRLTHTDRWSSSFEYFLSLLDGDTTDNNLLATSVYDYYLLPTDWLAFGKVQYQYDQFQAWENRLSAYGGLGYRVFHTRPFALTTKGGFGATHEFGDIDRTTPEAYAEVAFVWWIDERQSVEGSVNIAPDLTDFGSYRVLARLEWILRIDHRGLAVVGGVREEYQSNVPSNSTNNDFRYYLGIRYDF